MLQSLHYKTIISYISWLATVDQPAHYFSLESFFPKGSFRLCPEIKQRSCDNSVMLVHLQEFVSSNQQKIDESGR